MAVKRADVAAAQAALQSATRDLAAQRRQLAQAQQANVAINEAKHTVAHVNRLLTDLDHWAPVTTPIDPMDTTDEPQVATELATLAESQHASQASQASQDHDPTYLSPHALNHSHEELVRLRWLAHTYTHQANAWHSRALRAQAQGQAHADQCRRVVALCCNVEESRVEEILDELVVAVESDGPTIDLARVTGFMEVAKPLPVAEGGHRTRMMGRGSTSPMEP